MIWKYICAKQKIEVFSRRFSECDRYVRTSYNSWMRSDTPHGSGFLRSFFQKATVSPIPYTSYSNLIASTATFMAFSVSWLSSADVSRPASARS